MVAARAGQRAALSSLAASSMNHTQSNATPPQATPAETPRNEEGTVSKIDFAFEDVIDAQIRSAAVDVHIPWYVIDPQGRNIRNQRLREHARKHLDQQTADTSKFQARFKQASTSRILKSARQLPAPGCGRCAGCGYSRFRESYKQCDTRLSVRKVKRDAQVPGASRTNETQERYERPRNGPGPRRKLRARRFTLIGIR